MGSTQKIRVGLLSVLAMAAAFVNVTPPASAAVVKPLQVIYQDTVYGDLLVAGNGNLRCPTSLDGVATRPGAADFDACANAQAGIGTASQYTNNNEWFMKQNDVDSWSSTFNSSSIKMRIPSGAHVVSAGLFWGGHTGQFKAANGTTSSIPSCSIVGQQYPAFRSNLPPEGLAASDPADQLVGLSVDGDEPRQITANSVSKDDGAAWPVNSDRLYTAEAEVTTQLSDLESGVDHEITVSNIWAPEGPNCTGGWSLQVAYAFDEADIDFDAPIAPKQITILAGHVRQGASESSTDTTISGLNTVSNLTNVGVTAFEGDRGVVGDWFAINGVRVNEPTGLGSANDYYVSASVGASNPEWKSNFSIDNGLTQTTLIPAGSTDAQLSTGTNGDGYLLQGLQIVNEVPAILIRKSANISRGHAGDAVTWTVEVRNPSIAGLHNVTVTDPLYPGCNAHFDELSSSDGVQTITCSGYLPEADVTNEVSVVGYTDTQVAVEDQSSATVDVIAGAISIDKEADRPFYRSGDTVTFTVTVTNTGPEDLTNVTVTDPKLPSCNRTFAALAAGAVTQYTCSTTAPLAGDENTASVTGEDELGGIVTDFDNAAVPLIAPSISVEKTANSATAVPGDTITFVVKVTNTGDVDLHDVVVTDPLVSACSADIGDLAVGESRSIPCSMIATDADVTNTAEAVGSYEWCQPSDEECETPNVNDSDAVTVTVSEPPQVLSAIGGVEVIQAVCTPSGSLTDPLVTVPADQDGMMFTIEGDVTQGGSVTVTASAQEGFIFSSVVPGWMVASDQRTATTVVHLDQIPCSHHSSLPQTGADSSLGALAMSLLAVGAGTLYWSRRSRRRA